MIYSTKYIQRLPPGTGTIWFAARDHASACRWLVRARDAGNQRTRSEAVCFARLDWHSYLREMSMIKGENHG